MMDGYQLFLDEGKIRFLDHIAWEAHAKRRFVSL